MLMRWIVPVALALSLAACAKPEAGDSCDSGEGTCESSSSALICDKSALRLFQCRGSAGCTEGGTGGKDVCDFGRFKANDACPESLEGGAQCDDANVDQALQCTGGTMKAVACKGCFVQSNQVKCNP